MISCPSYQYWTMPSLTPFPPAIVEAIGPQAGQVLEAQARFAEACGRALRDGGEIDPEMLSAGDAAFEAAFSALQRSEAAQSMDFSETGRLFGLDFTLRRIRQNFLDLADRIRESKIS